MLNNQDLSLCSHVNKVKKWLIEPKTSDDKFLKNLCS